MFDRIRAFLERKPARLIISSGWVTIILLGVADRITGHEFEFNIFYLLPLLFVTWFTNIRAGVATSVLATLVWGLSDWGSSESLPNIFFQTWNSIIEFGFYLIFTLLLSALKDRTHQLEEMAAHDPLTGAANRRHFYELLKVEIARSRRYGANISIAYIDIDNFKTINDTYGHIAGDELLIKVASTLRLNMRNTDTVARLGGDEFVMLLPETDANEAHQALKKVGQFLRENVSVYSSLITFSIGVLTFKEFPESTEQMIQAADAVMYAVKENGKDHIRFESWPKSN